MWGRVIADIKTVWVAADKWERFTTEHAFSVFGDVTVFSWIIILDLRVTPSFKTLLMDQQYSRFYTPIRRVGFQLDQSLIAKVAAPFETTSHFGFYPFIPCSVAQLEEHPPGSRLLLG